MINIYDMFDDFFILWFLSLYQSQSRFNRIFSIIRTLMIVIPIIVAVVITIIIVSVLYKRGHIGSKYKKEKPAHPRETTFTKIARKMRSFGVPIETPLTREEKIDAKLQELGYKCQFCHAELKGEICEYCGRTNFRIR